MGRGINGGLRMKRGSTPINTFTVNMDLTGATVFITYKQGGNTIVEKTGSAVTITSTTLVTQLTQEETLAFSQGEVEMQIRYVFPDGTADASDVIKTKADRILKDGVITP